ncbi:hypothetical protein LJC32_04925 [Oscillospiraceae bacterium OttesenSCG-928-F05]|nr:hypothetical protein [Oscillospiraceae bacterium OttesenSCG-928-F05]
MSENAKDPRALLAEAVKSPRWDVITAFPGTPRKKVRRPLIAVALISAAVEEGAFGGYLGERRDPMTGQWHDITGKILALRFTLELCAPGEDDGGTILCDMFDAVADKLLKSPPERMTIRSIKQGDTTFDTAQGLFRSAVSVDCLMLKTDDGTDDVPVHLDVKGRLTYDFDN